MAIEKEDAIEEEKEDAIEEEAKKETDDGDTVADDLSAEASVQLKFVSVCMQFFM